MRKPELLVPASSLEVLKIAVIFGADAVYIGGEGQGVSEGAEDHSAGWFDYCGPGNLYAGKGNLS